jgi:PAS domain S-box-containing protein
MKMSNNSIHKEALEFIIKKHFGDALPINVNSFINDFKEQFSSKELNKNDELFDFSKKVKENQSELLKLQSDLLYAQKVSRIGSFYIDFINKESRFSKMAAELLGFNNSEALAYHDKLVSTLRKNILNEDLDSIDSAWAKAIEERSEFEIQFRVNGIEGKVITVNWLLKNTFSPSGKIIKVAGTLQDVTKKIENDQRNQTASLILEKSKVVLIKWSLDPGFPVVFVSKNISQFGYDAEDFISRKILFEQIIHPDDLQKVKTDIAEFHKNNIYEYILTYRILDSSGKMCWIQDQTFVNNIDDKIEVQGLLTDVTDKINAEEQIKSSEEKFRTLIQNSSDMVTILDEQGNIVYESPSFYKIFGYQPEEIIGKNAFELIHPEDLNAVLERFGNLVSESQEGNPVAYRFLDATGKYIQIESVGNNLLSNQHIKGLVVNSRDITERKNAEEQLKNYTANLERINKELDQFAYIVSHDLKAPLRAIFNLSEWIQEDLEDKLDENNREQFELLRSRIRRLENLIKGVLEYSRAGRMTADVEEFNTRDVVQEIVDSMGLPENAEINIHDKMPILNTERILIEQVFSNFISNAMKYNDKEKLVLEIGYKTKDKKHCFWVKDNGSGIPEEYYEKVFGIFQTLQSRDVVESTGIGLAIVKKIIEDKGGKAWVKSEIGNGSEFYFTWVE